MEKIISTNCNCQQGSKSKSKKKKKKKRSRTYQQAVANTLTFRFGTVRNIRNNCLLIESDHIVSV